MEINSTLFIQAIHFVVAWFLLKKLLLKPALNVIEEQQREREMLVKAVQKRQKSIEGYKQRQANGIREYRHFFLQHAPSISMYRKLFFFEPANRSSRVAPLKKEALEIDAHILVNDLVQQLKRVHV